MPATWECPSCKRRVPLSVEECRCGWQRSRVPIAAPRRSDPARGATQRRWEIWVGLAVAIVMLAWGIYWIVRPPAPSPATGILGFVDPTPAPPSTRPSSRPK
jgi:hypothetical protein